MHIETSPFTLPNHVYGNANELGRKISIQKCNITKILLSILVRLIICTFFGIALLGAAGSENLYIGSGYLERLFIIYAVMALYSLLPLRHLADRVTFYDFGFIYKGIINKKTIYFSDFRPKYLNKYSITIRGIRLAVSGEKSSKEIDITYILNFRKEFFKTYLNHYINTCPGEEKQTVSEIVYSAIPDGEIVTVVYAYWKETHAHSETRWDYALGINEEHLYIIPLFSDSNCIGYNNCFSINRNQPGLIDGSKKYAAFQLYRLFDKNKNEILKIMLTDSNTKAEPLCNFNIHQKQESQDFAAHICNWAQEINNQSGASTTNN